MANRIVRVVAAVIERDGKYLITQRRDEAVLPGLWEFPGGKVEEGESDAAALHREVADALRALGGSCAIRRSPLEKGPKSSGSWQAVTGGRPERETYLHLTDVAEVSEA